jgi:hypothetical protein
MGGRRRACAGGASVSITNTEAAILMRLMAPHQRDRLIQEAGDKVIDLREQFAREQRINRARNLQVVA